MVLVDYVILADAAAVADGKHYIHGGGWDTLAAPAFPAAHPLLAVAVRLRIPWSDTNLPHLLEVDVIDADGRSILPEPPGPPRSPFTVGRPATATPGGDQVLPLVFSLHHVQFPAPGTYAAVVRLDGDDQARSPFQVRIAPGR